MHVTEDLVREIAEETMKVLGPRANPVVLKKTVREVIRRLLEGGIDTTRSSTK